MTEDFVSNSYLGANLPEITSEIATTPKQIYRNTAHKIFKPKLIVLTNRSTTQNQVVKFTDADLTDSGEDTYKSESYVKFEVVVLAEETVPLKEDDLVGLWFRYGACAFNSTSVSAGSGVTVFISGKEE
jgi:hypothetical protein